MTLNNDYIFEKHANDQEYQRLRLIEQAQDPMTISYLQQVSCQPGQHCLEFGAGAGSITRWMAEQVGPQGKVVAIDQNTRYLENLDQPPIHVFAGDLLDYAEDSSFDLIHARYVLVHNQNTQQLLEKLYALLKPGGAMVLEEPDFLETRQITPVESSFFDKVNQAICAMFQNKGLRPGYGALLPQEIENTGFTVQTIMAQGHLCRGDEGIASVMAASTRALEELYLATGLVSQEDLQQYINHAQNPEYWAYYYTTVSVIAVKPN